MSVKEQIVIKLQEEGYDFLTAYGIAHKHLEELRARGPGTYTFHSQEHSFTVQIHAPKEKR